MQTSPSPCAVLGLALALAGCQSFAPAPVALGPLAPIALPTGQQITPTLPPASSFGPLKPALASSPELEVGGAVTEAVSPDGKTLAVLTTGFNRWKDPKTGKRDPRLQNEYVFLFDVSGDTPVQRQVLELANTWAGIAFAPDGKSLYVSGGVDDSIHTFAFDGASWVESGAPTALGHTAGAGPDVQPVAAGLAVTRDGRRIAVANMYNDSLSVVDVPARRVVADIDLRPGKSGGASGEAGGNYPYWTAIRGNDTAYVSSVRDREIVVVDLGSMRVAKRIELPGNPNKMILDRAQRRLFVAMDNADAVAVVDTATNTLATTIGTVAPKGVLENTKGYGGAAPNSLALSADESTLYVTDGGTNAIAVVDLRTPHPQVTGLIPTGWYPQHVVVGGPRSGMLYVVNSKSVPGPNEGNCQGGASGCPRGSPVRKQYNEYVLQLSKSGIQAMPIPAEPPVLAALTKQVEANNTFRAAPGSRDEATMTFLREHIRHVIYIIRENRTYDQLLGDLGRGNGDPNLAEFGARTTPNVHALATSLVTLDNFYDPAEVSGNGWPWSTGARESDFGVKMLPPSYAGRGGAYEWEGENRNVGMGVLGVARKATNPDMTDDPDFLPGTGNVAAPDGPDGERQRGYLWSAALRAGKTVRNYGFFVHSLNARDREPFAHGVKQAMSVDPELAGRTDEYFRGFDQALPETWREAEWEREFRGYEERADLPALSLVRFGGDHTGAFKDAMDGVNTPELQVAANDYAVGKLLETLAKSRYAGDTLVFIVEDDCQDGPDHVDAHRGPAFIAGPFVKHGAVVSMRYSTVNLLRTIEDVLGLDHLSLYTATQPPMTDVFDTHATHWSFTATVPSLLSSTALPLPRPEGASQAARPTHDSQYWAKATEGMDFEREDAIDAERYNRILWTGLMGNRPYPERRGKLDDD
jgi:DNA-binding beta-propeller fold protein YncE